MKFPSYIICFVDISAEPKFYYQLKLHPPISIKVLFLILSWLKTISYSKLSQSLNSTRFTVFWGVMKYTLPKCYCLSINYEIFILKWRFSATSQKSSQWFSSMTLYAKWPHKLVDFNNTYLPILAPTVQFGKICY